MTPLRIAQVAPLYEAVPPHRYGGTERVVSWLTEELVRRGHDVTLYASGDSRTAGRLVASVPANIGRTPRDATAPHVHLLGLLRERLASYDVVHSHLEYLPFPMLRPGDPPLATTLHGRLDLPDVAPVFRHWPRQPMVSISNAQRAPLADLRWVANIYHGLPLDAYPMGGGRGDYVLFLGRLSPEKRPHVAIDVARRAGIRLVIAAKHDPTQAAYFDEALADRLRGPGVEWIGETDLDTTITLLRDARALCFPVLWPEPFGLAMIEAMACGTPVVTRRCGSTPEIVAHGETGFVCDDDEALVAGLHAADRLDRAACRRRVTRCFSVATMADAYERVYRMLIEENATAWKTSFGYTTPTTSSPRPLSPTTALES